ncbi:helix-turn-helix domain-containing protein [Streptomyces sp. NPDC020983]|uniref:helix-turn-helix domain-containing protein n=1 Tax=Streptomyces sp. NPDC020983 TaxID=3365106 RepID=UPI0037A5D1E0
MYDRTVLRSAAKAAGIKNSNQLATKLGLPRNTAWRLWHGHTEPTAPIAAAVHAELGVPVAALLVPAEVSATADGSAA